MGIGTTPAADRYAGLALGPRNNIEFEVQPNLPVDASNASLRNLSPFRLRLVLPSTLSSLEIVRKPQGALSSQFTTNPDTGASEALPIRDPDIMSVASSSYNTFGSAKVLRDGATQPLIGNNQAQVSKKLGSRLTDVDSFISNGRLRTSRDTGAYVEPVLADRLMAADIALQVLQILEMPPLTLLINPDSFSVSFTQMQSYSERTRSGYVYQGWGEDQAKISFSGSIGAFVAAASGVLAPGMGQTGVVSGTQFAAKRDSASYQNLQNLFQIFRSNGYIYDTIGNSFAMHHVGSVAIEYDQWVYIGHMDSFGFGYEEDKQNGLLSFNIAFTASQIFDTHESLGFVSPLRSPEGLSVPPHVPENLQVNQTGSGTSIPPAETLVSGGSSFRPQGDGLGDLVGGFFGSTSQTPGTQGFRTP